MNFVHPKDAGGVLVELVQPAAGTNAKAVGDNLWVCSRVGLLTR